jgi:hypothetical protein
MKLTQAGMAMRLAFDLGLHLDMAPYVERGTILGEDAEARQVTFWAAYMSEQYVDLGPMDHTNVQLTM